MTQLLVSVRSAAEAEAALAGGAGLIDVKEPTRGSLGRADESTIAEVVRAVAGRVPVSAALGELALNGDPPFPVRGLAFVKWGLAHTNGLGQSRRDWREHLRAAGDWVRRANPGCQTVAAAYADGQRVEGTPSVEAVCAFARQQPGSVFLLDTCTKTAPLTLLDYLPLPRLAHLCRLCRVAGVRVALAGSLGVAQIKQLLPLQPDWFAVRGAACSGGQRTDTIDGDRVRQLVQLLEGGVRGSRRGSSADAPPG
jgi:uncharacterized protein (UPF0264 family)